MKVTPVSPIERPARNYNSKREPENPVFIEEAHVEGFGMIVPDRVDVYHTSCSDEKNTVDYKA
ncbi:hypothetical protein KW787_02540 [Candidatus Pacearchaeota archaeon]|nr:hypothetical protein [Candidatus Pacearchaeota archaeon]